MKQFICALTLATIILFTAGCSKSGDSPSSGPKAILTSGKWQITGGTVTLSYPGIEPITKSIKELTPSCMLDNYTIFKADGTGTTDEGATKCDPSAPQVKDNNGQWELQDNNTKLKLSDPTTGIAITCDILQLNDAGMQLHATITNQGAANNTIYIFTHIK